MNLTAVATPLTDINADWLIVPLWESAALPANVRTLGGDIQTCLDRGDITGKAKELTPFFQAKRVLVVGLGKQDKIDVAGLVAAAAAAAKHVTDKERRRLAIVVPEDVPNSNSETVAWALGIGLQQGGDGPGLRKTKPGRFLPGEGVLIASSPAQLSQVQAGAKRAGSEGAATRLARELVNLPPSELYPETFADRARQVAEKAGLTIDVWDQPKLERERMNSLLAVARGSERPPRLVVLRYRGGGTKTLGLVGKGVTFDSGGLSLKSTDNMVDMKCDMAGAATVLAAMQSIAEQKLPVNILGILALVENMPSGKAMKLGDVLTARNGKTIEVLNTDAEGRLILADALSFAVEEKVDHLIDLATLTGACLVALGSEVAGLMSNHEGWSQQVLAAAGRAGEKAWPLPMFPLYNEMIKSDIADMKNTGGSRYAGAISAAKFLEEFVGDVPWAHLDIAGPAWAEKGNATREPGGTGAFVRTLVETARTYR